MDSWLLIVIYTFIIGNPNTLLIIYKGTLHVCHLSPSKSCTNSATTSREPVINDKNMFVLQVVWLTHMMLVDMNKEVIPSHKYQWNGLCESVIMLKKYFFQN